MNTRGGGQGEGGALFLNGVQGEPLPGVQGAEPPGGGMRGAKPPRLSAVIEVLKSKFSAWT